MTEPRWLDGYSGQTTDELIALDGAYRTDSIVLAFEQAIDRKAERLGHEQLSPAERVVLDVEALERQVNSDGYISLFTYYSQHVPGLVSALTAIGADGVAELTRSAIAALGIDGPLTPEAVESAANDEDDDRDERLEAFDDTYYETAGDLAVPLLAYIAAHRDEIVLP